MSFGDRAALETFYRRHQGLVTALIYRVLRSEAETDELRQEVFFELWRRAPQYDASRGAVKAWVCQITKCRAIDAQRARKRRCYDRHLPEDSAPVAIAVGQAPDELSETSQKKRRVRRAMGTLPAPQRQSVTLSFFDGLSHREISNELGVPLGTVKSRILSGVKRLKNTLSQPTCEWEPAKTLG